LGVACSVEMVYAAVLYLSPILERRSFDLAVASVAHELAHIALKHNLHTGEEYDKQEREAWALIMQWGFTDEERRHRAYRKAMDAKWRV